MTNKRYSIIIPHKNSFDFLKRLLKTIPSRDDFEIIIVDDNSKPDEKEKLKNCMFNNNITVIYNNKSQGAGRARNIALEHATAKWILFADADDYFSDNMEIIIDNYFDSDDDIIYFGSSSIYPETDKIAYRHIRNMKLVNDYIKNNNKEDALRYFYTPPVSKMIRREIIENNKIRFEEIIASNDVYFSLKTAFHAKSISATSEILYIITLSNGSLTNIFSRDNFDARFNAALRANDFLCSINKNKYQLSVLYYIIKSYSFGLNYMIYVMCEVIKHRSNIFIGLEKIFDYKKVLNTRENKKYMLKKF